MNTIKKNVISFVLVMALVLTSVTVMPVSGATNVTTISNLKFAKNDDGSCTITWNKLDGGSYNIYKASSRFAKYEKVGTSSDASYNDKDYNGEYYKVSFVKDGKEYTLSNPTSYEIKTFGYNTAIFEDTDNTTEVQKYIDNVYKTTEAGQFISDRYAMMFAPGTYSDNLNVNVGFYTQVAGMGISPKDTTLGNITCKAEWMKGKKYDGSVNYNALCNFWRSVENLTTTNQTTMWAVSQATSMRRMNIKGNLYLHQDGGYASGGFLADTKVAGTVSGGSQQQWLTRNSEMSNFEGVVWNNVLVGCGSNVKGVEKGWPYAANTVVEKTPEEVEKPFLTANDGEYSVFVPKVKNNTVGVSWSGDKVDGEFIDLDKFYVAKPGDSVAKINSQLNAGKNLILTPGIYSLDAPIEIKNEDTIVLGLGYATLKPTNGNECMKVADVGGVSIAGVLFDAGQVNSSTLLTVGTAGNKTSHKDNPITLCDTFYRVGGADETPGKATTCVIINSSDVIGDNFWVWRADHGKGVGWTKNTADHGVIINGDNVTTYGLMVEHFQKYQTMWNGNGGKCYMYQSELPYDIPNQSSWNASGSYGYTDYKVADNVTSHEGYGIGIYSCYQAGTCFLKSAIECPDTPNVKFTNVCTYSLSGNGGIDYAINNSGYAVMANGEMCKVMSYNNGNAAQDKTYENARKYIWGTTVDIKGKTDLFSDTFKATYTGKNITPKVTVKYKNITLREGIDYKVVYKNNKKIGTAKIYVIGLNNFKDSNTYKMKIIPAKTKITKKKATKKKITLKLKKVKGATGYQVMYSLKKNFKGKKKINTKKRTVVIKRKKSGKYYVKVRAYKKIGKKYVYGNYTKRITIK